MGTEHTTPGEATRRAEEDEAVAEHRADRPASPAEAERAASNRMKPAVAEHYQDMAERGASQKGEGRI